MRTSPRHISTKDALDSLRTSLLSNIVPTNGGKKPKQNTKAHKRWLSSHKERTDSLTQKYKTMEESASKTLHLSFFHHLNDIFGFQADRTNSSIKIRDFSIDTQDVLQQLHNQFYQTTLLNKEILSAHPDSKKQDLKNLLRVITNRSSAKPWFDYHKLLIDKGVLEFNKDNGTLPNSKFQDVTEFKGETNKSSENLLNFLRLLKTESLKQINESYEFKDLFPPRRWLSPQNHEAPFNILYRGFIQKFEEEITGISSELQVKLFKDVLNISNLLNIKMFDQYYSYRHSPDYDSTFINSLENIIELFTNTLKQSSEDSFRQALINNDLESFLENFTLPRNSLPRNPFRIKPENKKLYELALSNNTELPYDEFQQYIDELSKLANGESTKELLQKVLDSKELFQNNETEGYVSLLKKLTDILDIETLLDQGLVPNILSLKNASEILSSRSPEFKRIPISQEDMMTWLEKIEKKFDISEEVSKTNIADFIRIALIHQNNKEQFKHRLDSRSYINNYWEKNTPDRKLFEFDNEEQAQDLATATIADSPPYMPGAEYNEATRAANRVAAEAINQSRSFWPFAWLARSIPQDIPGQLEALTENPQALGYKSILEEFAEHLSLKPFQRLTSEKAQDYPGTGFIINGLNLPKILGFEDVSDNDIESKNIYKLWINAIESLLSKDPKNSGYLQNRYNLSGITKDAEKSRFILSRGFIAITPPDKLTYGIRCSDEEYQGGSKYRNFIDDKNKLHKTSRWNIRPEHFSLIVFNDHFGGHENHERSYLVPTKVLEKALNQSVHPESHLREYSSSDKKYLDFTGAKMKLTDLQDIAEEMKLPLLDLASSSNIGSLSNAFPKGWKTYHDWENDLDHKERRETQDNTKGHYHKTHYQGRGYKSDMTPYMHHIYPLQEAENNIDHTASSLQGIHKVLQLSLNSFINGRSFISPEKLGLASIPPDRNPEPNAHYMLAKAYKINSALLALSKEKKEFPILVKNEDFTRLSRLPATYPQLDTYDMKLKTLDENGTVQERQLDSDPNNPETLKTFLETFMNNTNPDKSKKDIFKGIYFMPREILFKKPNFTRDHHAEITE